MRDANRFQTAKPPHHHTTLARLPAITLYFFRMGAVKKRNQKRPSSRRRRARCCFILPACSSSSTRRLLQPLSPATCHLPPASSIPSNQHPLSKQSHVHGPSLVAKEFSYRTTESIGFDCCAQFSSHDALQLTQFSATNTIQAFTQALQNSGAGSAP